MQGNFRGFSIYGILLAGFGASQVSGGGTASIVGGKSISITEAPWQVLASLDDGMCGGTWLGGRWVMTAAHCIEDASPSQSYIYAGITRLSTEQKTANRTPVAEMIECPAHKTNGDADIALIRLSADITSTLAKPIRYATPYDANAGLTSKGVVCMASGWGGINADGSKYPDSLQMGMSKVYDTTRYNFRWGGQGGTQPAGQCFGDSGGPVVVKDAAGNWILAGVASTIGSFCGDPNKPVNYGRVSAVADWIKQVTGIAVDVGDYRLADSRVEWTSGRLRLSRSRSLELAVFDPAGTAVWRNSGVYPAGEHVLPVSGLPSGRYFLRVIGDGPVQDYVLRTAR